MHRAVFPVLIATHLLFANPGAAQTNACDLATPYGTVDVSDVQAAINMALGASPCTANIGGGQICNVATVQRVINAALPGGICEGTRTGVAPHSVTLNWTASTSSNVKYRIYRATSAGGPYVALNSTPVSGLTYVDYNVRGGTTYYYIARAVDDATGAESSNSNEAPAAITAP